MLKYNYLTLRGESRLRPQYLLLYGSHFAVIPVEASPSKNFYFKTSRFVEILSEASPSFNANVLMHCKPRLCPRFFQSGVLGKWCGHRFSVAKLDPVS